MGRGSTSGGSFSSFMAHVSNPSDEGCDDDEETDAEDDR
jgi:hypothetical protein